MKEVRVYDVTTHIGNGFPIESLKTALKWEPHVLVAQGTSTDPGPYYLGSGELYGSEEGVKRDLRLIIRTSKEYNIPFVLSVGGAGSDIHVEKIFRIIDKITREEGIKLRVAYVRGEIDKEWLKKKILAGSRARRLVDIARLSEYLRIEDIEESVRIVAQMGPEPIMKALDLYFKGEIEGVIVGRSLDVAVVAAYPLKLGFPKNIAYHMAKILECGALAAEPGSGNDGLFGIATREYFLVKPPNPKRRCTVKSVAAHAFYERDNPFMEKLPDGFLDVASAEYIQYDDRTVMVRGSRFIPSSIYTVKLEGVKLVGYRTISIAGIRDPVIIKNISAILRDVVEVVKENLQHLKDEYIVNFRLYGINGVLGVYEPLKDITPHEIGILIDVVAKTQELANSICSFVRATLLHHEIAGGKTTASGNLAFPFSPTCISVGPVYQFNIWHALELEDPLEPFKSLLIEFPRG